jgi:hypothetical protein
VRSEDEIRREVRRIRESRSLREQKQIAASGQNPMTGRWWPRWREWKPTERIRMIFSRFTSTTGRAAGMRRSYAKTVSCRQNGLAGARYGILGARHGAKGGRPKHATPTGRARQP